MGTPHTQFDSQAIQASWQAFDSMARLRHIRTEADYKRMVAVMNALLDEAGDDQDHPLFGLLELVGDLVSKYEQEHYAIDPAEPKEALCFLKLIDAEPLCLFMLGVDCSSVQLWRKPNHDEKLDIE